MESAHNALCIITLLSAVLCGLYTAISRNGRTSGLSLAFLLILAAAIESINRFSLASPDALSQLHLISLLLESIIPFGLTLYCFSFIRRPARYHATRLQKTTFLAAVSFPFLALIANSYGISYRPPDFVNERILFLTDTGFLFYVAQLLLTVASLISLEQLYLAMDKPARWKIKLEMLGVGVLAIMHVVYYGQAILYRTLDFGLLWSRTAAVLIGIVMVAFSRWRRGAPKPIHLSKSMAYRSLLAILIGVYFIGLALLGEGMRYLGGRTGTAIGTTLLLILGLMGGLAILSERVRRHLKVYLAKNFYRSKFDYRQQWMQLTQKISSSTDLEELERSILEYFCDTFGVEGAALFSRDADSGTYQCVAVRELNCNDHALGPWNPLIVFLGFREWVFDVKDQNEEVIGANQHLFKTCNVRFVIPLYGPKGELIGFIALKSPLNPSEVFAYEDYDLMKMLSRQAGSAISNIRLSSQLSTAQQMEVMGRISAFVMHDLKNLVSNLALVVENAREFIEDPEFQVDMLKTLENTSHNMTDLISRLETLRESAELKLQPEDLLKIAGEVCSMLPKQATVLTGKEVTALVDAREVSRVLLNLVLNALEASAPDAVVELEVGKVGMPFVSVRDKGQGMTEEFMRKRLFKPFSSTKKKGFGIGLYQSKKIVEAHGGRIDVESQAGAGSTFTVFLPNARRA